MFCHLEIILSAHPVVLCPPPSSREADRAEDAAAREQKPAEMPDEEDDLYERSPPHAMPHACPQGAGTALMSRETCRLAGHRVTSASGRSPRRMWSRWARLGHIPSGRPIVLRTYTLCHTPQCTAHRRAAVARSSAHPATLAHAGEEAQPRGVPGEVSQLARSVAQRVAAPSERLSGPEPNAHTGTGGQG